MKLLSRKYFVFLTLVYSVFIFYVTTIPFNANLANWPSLWPRIFSIWQDTNLYTSFYTSPGDILANCMLFGVLGILLKSCYSPHEERHKLKVFLSILFGFLFCYFIEVLQELFPDRRSSLIDIWVDTLSCTAGILFIWLLQVSSAGRFMLQWLNKTLRTNPYLLGMLILSAVYLLGALLPFRIDYHFSRVGTKFLEGDFKSFFVHDWGNALFQWKSALIFTLYGLLGFTAYLTFLLRGSLHFNFPWLKAFLFSGSVAVLAEIVPILFTYNSFELYLIEVGLMGSLSGAALSKCMSSFLLKKQPVPSDPTGRFKLLSNKVLFFGFALIALFDWFKPFQFDFSYSGFQAKLNSSELVPFYSYARIFTHWTVADFFRKLTILSGLSGWIAFWLWRDFKTAKSTLLLTAVVAASLVFCLELMQIFVVGRHLAITDVAVGFLAGLIGGSVVHGIKKVTSEEPALRVHPT